MRYFGRDRIAELIRTHVAWAHEFASMVECDSRFEVCAPVPLSVVCFRYKGTDDENRAILEAVNATGHVFLSHTALDGRIVLRLAIGNMGTTREDVLAAWELIQQAVPK